MRIRHVIAGLAVAGLGFTAHGTAWAQRVLVDQADMRISVWHMPMCGEPVEVRVEARDPGVYERHETELQPVIDAVRAMLTFECRGLPALGISGTLSGMQEEIFYAMADPTSDWLMVSDRAVRVTPSGAEPTAGPAAGLIGTALPPPTTHAIAGLSVGMSLDEAMVALDAAGGGRPRYDARDRRLSVRDGGCPADFDWNVRRGNLQPGWWCLDAHFDGEPDTWLTGARLAQVLDGDRRDRVIEALAERYGEPTMQYTTGNRLELTWGQRIDGADVPDFHRDAAWPLSAEIDASDQRTVLMLQLRSSQPEGDDAIELRF